MKIYLADLIYDTVNTSHMVPLNVGYLAAYLEARFRNDVEIRIFKYPSQLESAIKSDPPDLLGLSHYTWNVRLNKLFLAMVKRLNPDVVTVMGGPNISRVPADIHEFLMNEPNLDYHIIREGEEPIADLVEGLLGGQSRPQIVDGAMLLDGEFIYKTIDFKGGSKTIDTPSPYLTGWMDPFLKIPGNIPLLETNRGCPYGCSFCAWGGFDVSKVRTRDQDVVYEEINYIADNSVGQVNWILCDANFGILPRDVDIARNIRSAFYTRNLPTNLSLFGAKNNTKRNVEIAEILGTTNNERALVALQSADLDVLANTGRGTIKFDALVEQLQEYRARDLDTRTDLLLGLAGESWQSHLSSLRKCMELDFDSTQIYNVRLLPGTVYESKEQRETFKILTKFRPILGAYGVYDGKIVFELEEQVRGTKDMTEEELNSFKVLHWLVYFAWNMGMFKPILKLAKNYGVNPIDVFVEMTKTKDPNLRELFDRMTRESMEEWFTTKEEMIEFYEKEENFHNLVHNFKKLHPAYTASVYTDRKKIRAMETELMKVIRARLEEKGVEDLSVVDSVLEFNDLAVCKDPLQDAFTMRMTVPGVVAGIAVNDKTLFQKASVDVEISRPKEFADFCRFHLARHGEEDLSPSNLSWFMETGGLDRLRNVVRIAA